MCRIARVSSLLVSARTHLCDVTAATEQLLGQIVDKLRARTQRLERRNRNLQDDLETAREHIQRAQAVKPTIQLEKLLGKHACWVLILSLSVSHSFSLSLSLLYLCVSLCVHPYREKAQASNRLMRDRDELRRALHSSGSQEDDDQGVAEVLDDGYRVTHCGVDETCHSPFIFLRHLSFMFKRHFYFAPLVRFGSVY